MPDLQSIDLVKAGLLNPVLHWSTHNGIRIEKYLDQLSIPGELILNDSWVTKYQAFKLLHDIGQHENCKELGFIAYDQFKLEHLGPVVNSLEATTTFREALNLHCWYAPRVSQGNEHWVQVKNKQAWLCMKHRVELPGHQDAAQISLSVLMRLFEYFFGSSWKPKRIFFQNSTTVYFNSIPWLEECHTSFGHKYTAIEFPAEFLSRLNSRNDLLFSKASRDKLNLPNTDENFTQTLQRLLTSRLAFDGIPTLKELSIILSLSERTIKRRLYSEGVSYREIVDRVRFSVARKMLTDPHNSIKDIAHELGYSNSKNFFHAFKRITGQTPTDYSNSLIDNF